MKTGILLLHSTVYGISFAPVGWIQPVLSININVDTNPDHWSDTLFGFGSVVDTTFGTVAGNTPIDTVHWNISGAISIDQFSPKNRCLFLLTRM